MGDNLAPRVCVSCKQRKRQVRNHSSFDDQGTNMRGFKDNVTRGNQNAQNVLSMHNIQNYFRLSISLVAKVLVNISPSAHSSDVL